MRRPSRSVVGYALLFSVPTGAGFAVAVATVGGDGPLALLSGVTAAAALFAALLAAFSAGTTDITE